MEKVMLSSFKIKYAKQYPRILMRYCKLTKCLYKDTDYRANILVSFRRCYSINYVQSSITQEIGYFLEKLHIYSYTMQDIANTKPAA